MKAKLQWMRRLWAAMFVAGVAGTAGGQEQLSTKEVQPSSTSDSKAETPSKFRSAEDGMLDFSGFLDEAYGFIPLVVPITEPAVGFGGAAALIFIDKPEQKQAQAGFGRPNITVVGGMRTDNGSKGAFAGDGRYWLDDRLQTLFGFLSASINLEFSGIGSDSFDSGDPKTYNLDTNVGIAQVKYRLGNSKHWVGLRYAMGDTTVKFDVLPSQPVVPDVDKNTRVAGLTPYYTYDSRDSIFTPSRGSYLEIAPGIFREGLGSDVDFERSTLVGMYYTPLSPRWTLGLRADVYASSGDVPFYLRPSISMRGVPALSQQGEYVAQTEAELRWQFWGRFSLVGFGGAGKAWNNFEHFDNERNVTAGGLGFRYELARKYGLHVGLDVAGGPDGPAYYIQFGSAWGRP